MFKIVRGQEQKYHEVHTLRRTVAYLFVQGKDHVPITAIMTLHSQTKIDENKDHFQEFNLAIGRIGIFNLKKEADTTV